MKKTTKTDATNIVNNIRHLKEIGVSISETVNQIVKSITDFINADNGLRYYDMSYEVDSIDHEHINRIIGNNSCVYISSKPLDNGKTLINIKSDKRNTDIIYILRKIGVIGFVSLTIVGVLCLGKHYITCKYSD